MLNTKKFFLILLVVFAVVSAFFIFEKTTVFATNPLRVGGNEGNDTDSEEIKDLEKKISELEKKLDEIQNTEASLSSELDQINGQISLTQSRIEYSNAQISAKEEAIKKIAVDIDNLSTRIEKLQKSIEYQKHLLNERSRERYKNLSTSPFEIFLGSDTVSQLVQKTQYLKIVELQDTKLLSQMNTTKQNYSMQQDLFEQKKDKETELKAQIETEKSNLVTYKTTLDDKQAEKEKLLKVTQNDEAKYQELLAQAQKELNQIVNAVAVLKNQDAKKVKKGELIGIQGNTGFSNGDHLHFGVYKYSSFSDIDGWNWYYNNYVDPLKKLKSKNVYWNTGCGNDPSGNHTSGKGDWDWPLSSVTISQNFGSNTCYNWMYGGNPHPAIDMYGPYGSPVYAVEDGDAYFCRNCLGDGANGVFIFHDGDYMTVYWHLQ